MPGSALAKSALPQPLPLTLGSGLSGIVEALGSKVTAFEPGDPVFGVTNSRFTGAYAEFAVVSAGMIAKENTRLSDIDAAPVPVRTMSNRRRSRICMPANIPRSLLPFKVPSTGRSSSDKDPLRSRILHARPGSRRCGSKSP
jgi:hypothetical protein